MTRMTGPDCAVMCNLINIYTYMHTYIHRIIRVTVCFGKIVEEDLLRKKPVGTAIMTTTVTSANRVDLESYSSQCWTFRRTHTSADPIRVFCARLALPLTLALPSRLAPRARLTVDVPTRALWLGGIFLHVE